MEASKRKAVATAVGWGITSVILYFLLYYFEQPILQMSRQGGWYFIIPVSIAFIFSWVHGNFTGYFWDALGIKAKATKK